MLTLMSDDTGQILYSHQRTGQSWGQEYSTRCEVCLGKTAEYCMKQYGTDITKQSYESYQKSISLLQRTGKSPSHCYASIPNWDPCLSLNSNCLQEKNVNHSNYTAIEVIKVTHVYIQYDSSKNFRMCHVTLRRRRTAQSVRAFDAETAAHSHTFKMAAIVGRLLRTSVSFEPVQTACKICRGFICIRFGSILL